MSEHRERMEERYTYCVFRFDTFINLLTYHLGILNIPVYLLWVQSTIINGTNFTKGSHELAKILHLC